MKQNEKSGVTACTKVGQVHSQTSLTASHDITSFVGQRRDAMRWPPALNKKLFGTECDTHTERRYRRSREITNHLKSLRKKGKEKTERETQRAREKDRGSHEAH